MADIRTKLLLGAAVGGLALVGMPAAAQNAAISAQTATQAAPIEERQSYALRLMTQIYDGSNDHSSSQVLGIGRVRQGDKSYTQFDYGDGARVITAADGQLSAERFLNLTGTEKTVMYDYSTQTMQGDLEIANLHNVVIRPFLNRSPKLGSDASWSQQIALGELRLRNLGGADINVELSREYFVHVGKPMVLIHYAIPAFSYDPGTGMTAVQWGSGISLTDPGFGMIYLNSALHRAVVRDNKTSVPYRFARTMVAANPDGSAMIDYREVPQLQKYVDEFFSAEAMRVVATHFHAEPLYGPLDLMRRLDLVALSIAENGANEAPSGAAAQTSQNTGSNISNMAGLTSTAGGFVGNLYTWTDLAVGSPQSVERVLAIMNTADVFAENSQTIKGQINQAVQRLEAAEDALVSSRSAPVFEALPELKAAEQFILDKRKALDYAADVLTQRTMTEGMEIGQVLQNWQRAKTDLEYALAGYEVLVNDPGSYRLVPSPAEARAAAEFRAASENLIDLSTDLARYGDEGIVIIEQVKKIPPTHWDAAKSYLGGGLTLLGNAINGYTIGSSLANLSNQGGSNLATGNAPKLTRTYGSALSGDQRGMTAAGLMDLNLALDILGVVGAAASGDLITATTTATAIVTSSVSDIIISAKGLKDINVINSEAARLGRDLARRQKEQYIALSEAKEKAFRDELAKLDREIATLEKYDADADNALKERMQERGLKPHQVNDPNWTDARIDPSTGLPTPGYWQYLKDNYPGTLASYGIDPEAPVGGWPGGVGPQHKPRPVAGTRPPQPDSGPSDAELRAGLAEEINKPQYPTAPPRDPDATQRPRPPKPTLAEQGFVTETPQEKWLRETREENAKATEELKAYQDNLLANREESTIFDGDYEMRVSSLEMSELVVTSFNLKPVTSDPVNFDMPVFDEDGDLFVKNEDGTTSLKKVGPDDFEGPEFDAPEVSKLPPTDPNDEDGYPGTGEYPAFGFDNMSGTLNVDLSRWEDWLATQDIKKLISLAIAAGYPYAPGSDGMATLAIALNDAENIIRLSQDEGYRRWANQAPSCSGYVGCGPQYLGRWTMKRSIVALGDILVQSRGVFSTGGFSDIGISGFNLAYMLRDFGIQDGDLIDVEIQQFGRTIATLKNHFLTTAGDNFAVNLRPGVASMVVTALNEGSASPNTAEVTIDNVVRGVARQTYNLNTGQTATLRIEANATPE